jgi:hypothetical protein
MFPKNKGRIPRKPPKLEKLQVLPVEKGLLVGE